MNPCKLSRFAIEKSAVIEYSRPQIPGAFSWPLDTSLANVHAVSWEMNANLKKYKLLIECP
jgi:hypothetical protein